MAESQGISTLKIDLPRALGAEPEVSDQCFSVYIPNKDKDGKEIGTQWMWVLRAIRLLAEINEGATAMPPVEGSWFNPESGQIVSENPVVVYSYIKAERFVSSLPRIREFLHRLGRETNQGEIGIEFGPEFFRIRRFDPE